LVPSYFSEASVSSEEAGFFAAAISPSLRSEQFVGLHKQCQQWDLSQLAGHFANALTLQ